MRAQRIGQILGLGMRLAGRAAGHDGPSAQSMTQTSRRVARGVGGFLAPFHRIGAIVWNEVMGVLFLLFALVALPTLWKSYANWRSGGDHHTFAASVVVFVLFSYLGISSFRRAGRRARKQ